MKKPFSRLEIQPNDDGTFNIEVYPVEKRSAKGEMVVSAYEGRKTISASNAGQAVSKLRKLMGADGTVKDIDKYLGIK